MAHPFHTFYRRKRVLVTGHSGFQGGWTVAWLKLLGAQVCGYGLPPAARPNFFDATLLDRGTTSIFADVRDRNSLASAFAEFQPEIVIHCACRSTPQLAIREPVETFHTNVMGTVFILEEARLTKSVRVIVNLCSGSHAGAEPKSFQSASKTIDIHSATMASIELASSAYMQSFFRDKKTAVGIAVSADAIGGGDWREGRTVPNLVRSIMYGEPVDVRNGPILPIWHVLDASSACLSLAQRLFENGQKHSGVWEFSPNPDSHISATQLAKDFVQLWDEDESNLAPMRRSRKHARSKPANSSKVEAQLGWSNILSKDEAIAWTVEWYRSFYANSSKAPLKTEEQIERYMSCMA